MDDRNDSKILRREVSSSIQVISPVKTLWKGEAYSEISVKLLLDKKFVSTNKHTYRINTYIQDCNSGLIFDGSGYSNLIEIQFQNGVQRNILSSSSAIVTQRKSYVNIKINHDLFEAGGQFIVVVDLTDMRNADADNTYIYFGVSQVIT